MGSSQVRSHVLQAHVTLTRLTAWKLHADQQVQEDANPKERGWFSNLLTGPSSSIALAFLCNKALLPVRAPVTIGLTPMVARYSTPVPTAYMHSYTLRR